MHKFFILGLLFIFQTHLCGHAQQAQNSFYNDPSILTETLAKPNCWGDSILLGYSKTHQPIYAYCFNKGGNKKAFILAGVHGSEWGGVNTGYALLDSLRHLQFESFPWTIVVVPELFVDNVKKGRMHYDPNNKNKNRFSCETCVDPNRQMPKPTQIFKNKNTKDAFGRSIEMENHYLLMLVQAFQPERIASLHTIRPDDKTKIFDATGVFADPQTGKGQKALGYEKDRTLAIEMAKMVLVNKGSVAGNVDSKENRWSTVYYSDPKIANRGEWQKRSYNNYLDSIALRKEAIKNAKLQNADATSIAQMETDLISVQRKFGCTFGTWASSTIYEKNVIVKPAATMITCEQPDFSIISKTEQKINIEAYCKAILHVFLEKE